jgi:sigma-E factor negative regulatory protein RseA
MSDPKLDPLERRQLLSSLADGQADAEACRIASRLWADDPEARAAWHEYQLIGDVLRSDDLASTSAHDAAFLASLRLRLAAEPAVLAPGAMAAPAAATPPMARARGGRLGLAAVAGFMLLGAVAMVFRSTPTAGVTQQAAAGGAAAPSPVRIEPPTLVVNGKLIRDAQLDRYLNAHREIVVGQPSALPGGAMRSIETVVLER